MPIELDRFVVLPPPLLGFLVLTLGSIIGSFANVCIYRIPKGQSVVAPRSRCPRCERPIAGFDNVPVLSWLILRGRCRSCRAPISIRYPLVELANGGLWLGLLIVHGPSVSTVVLALLSTALLVLALIDLEHQILPDVITLPGIVLGVGCSFLPQWPVGPLVAIAAAAGGFLVFWGVAAAYRISRGVDGLGQGDWKLAALLGAFFGWQMLLFIVFAASIGGTAVGLVLATRRSAGLKHALPFGTFLGFAAILAMFVGSPTLRWYGGFFRG